MRLIKETETKLRYKSNQQFKYGIFECVGCMTSFEASLYDVNCGRVKSCGCLNYKKPLEERISGLNVIKDLGFVNSRRMALFECMCGTHFEFNVSEMASKRGRKHCGCVKREYTPRPQKENKVKQHPLYSIWKGMRARCSITSKHLYQRYSGRGISLCDRWRESFELFVEDIGPRPSLKHSVDRIDNDGNYEPSNCRWATATEQSNNKGVRVDNTNGAVGVTYDKAKYMFRARVKVSGKLLDAGAYDTIEEAVEARNDYIIKNNLPNKTY